MKLSQISKSNSRNEASYELTQRVIELVGDRKLPFFSLSERVTIRVIFCGKDLWISAGQENNYTIEVSEYRIDGCWVRVFKSGNFLTETRIKNDPYNAFLALANEEKYQYVKCYKFA